MFYFLYTGKDIHLLRWLYHIDWCTRRVTTRSERIRHLAEAAYHRQQYMAHIARFAA